MKLPKTYNPKDYEENIYALWEKSRAFEPVARGSKESFSLVIPPPNANAGLHIGTGMTLALEDIVVRYQRMLGKKTLFLPGADHAGFETQAVYEKHLAKEGKSRFDFSREELYDQVYDFVAQNRSIFETQFRQVGASLDWSRYTFTLDDHIVHQAYATFKKMWDEGLIYRGERLVNFCTFHGTGFADIEVEHQEVEGSIWHIRYPLTDGSGEVVVATTRPETMLGDTAVAVHPKDERYKDFHGKTVKLPLTEREIPIIVDDFVDQEFGTGAVKITPAHDPNDFEAGKRHDLPMISVITHEGKMDHATVPKQYGGLDVEQAREAVIADLTKGKFLVKTEKHTHNVGHCYKCGTIIQPLLREQWFVDMQPLAKKAVTALNAKKIAFYPDAKREQLVRYLKGLRDWNISRQIAWGIPIPAFQNIDNPSDWIFDTRVSQEVIEVDGKFYKRDPDVFDTWFSSSSWPYATLRYPDHEDFKEFYPLSLMETGGEILYQWVGRMIMLGLYVTDSIPFKEVYIHGYVMAEDGSKMSKSVGNVVDPLPVIEQFGSDALRMGIIAGRTAAVNRGFDRRKVEEARNFCNKLWNIARFTEEKVGEHFQLRASPVPKTNADHWMLWRLNEGVNELSTLLSTYRFGEAYEYLYHLVWDDLADWYIEASKAEPNHGVLAYALETVLKLAHPFAPFLTETIWQTLEWEKDELLVISSWPKVVKTNDKKAKDFDTIKSIVTEIRAIKKTLGVYHTSLFFTDSVLLKENAELIKRLAQLDRVEEIEAGSGLSLTQTDIDAWLDINPEVAKKYRDKLRQQISELDEQRQRLEIRLGNKSYVDKAPKELVLQTKAELKEVKEALAKVNAEFDHFTE